ncbi:hypothetical protein AUP41_03615 [Thalassospira xiamenensis]|nr:hypothetical protein AUP41_03615 [Thalassospira xiamenensis]
MRTKNVQRELDQNDLIAVPETFVRNNTKILQQGDILVSSANSWDLVGKCCYVSQLGYKATAGGFISILRSKSKCDSRYLYHWLNSPITQHKVRHCGRQTTNISNLHVERFLKLELPVPSLEEQRRIAAILDKAGVICWKQQQALTLADDFLRSTFLEMFGDPVLNPRGWKQVKLSELIRPKDKINYGVVQPGESLTDGIPIVRVGDFGNLEINKASLKKISPEVEKNYKRSRLVGDEILISCVGSIGLVALVDQGLQGMNIARAVARVPLRDDIVREFVAYALKSRSCQNHFRKETRTVSQPTLNISLIAETPITLPPLELQQKFELAVRKAKSFIHKQIAQKQKAEELFASLCQRAFRGEL